MSAVDVDGDEFMQPQLTNSSINKFVRSPGVLSTCSSTFDFPNSSKNFNKQYAAIYFTRLTHLRPTVLATAQQTATSPKYSHLHQAGETPKVCLRVPDIQPDRYCIVAGTIYKEMKLKPCILEEYNKTAHGSANSMAGQVYISPDDSLVLEDEYGRVSLVGSSEKLNIRQMMSGLVVAVLGREVPGGKFEVEEVFYPGLAPQKPFPQSVMASSANAESKSPAAYLLCVSGLCFGRPGQDPMPVQLLMDYVSGLLGSSSDQESSARIVRVLIGGNSLHRFEKKKTRDFSREETDSAEIGKPLKELDLLLTQIAAAVPVDIIPGDQDPSNFTLPQQPFHRCLFPSASTFSTFKSSTNPTWMEMNGLQVLATAGQNVNDLAKYAEAPSNIDFLEGCMYWRNVAPTAPDTLGCFPYQDKDPFVLEESPHIYIVGNQPSYDTRLVTGSNGERIRLVSLPVFANSGTVALIDLNSPTLETQSMAFKVQTPMQK